jgi:hypothetical protein
VGVVGCVLLLSNAAGEDTTAPLRTWSTLATFAASSPVPATGVIGLGRIVSRHARRVLGALREIALGVGGAVALPALDRCELHHISRLEDAAARVRATDHSLGGESVNVF